MYKRMVVLLVFGLFLASAVMAANSSVGYLDIQKVFKEYKETAKAQTELDKKQKDFQKDFEDSQKKLLDAEKTGKSKVDLEKMRKELETKLEPKRDELLKINQELTIKLQKKIVDAGSRVAKKLALDLVVDKQVVIVGGMDVTDLVLSELNK